MADAMHLMRYSGMMSKEALGGAAMKGLNYEERNGIIQKPYLPLPPLIPHYATSRHTIPCRVTPKGEKWDKSETLFTMPCHATHYNTKHCLCRDYREGVVE